jgi:ABC-type uncharacterized transport system permease subunit
VTPSDTKEKAIRLHNIVCDFLEEEQIDPVTAVNMLAQGLGALIATMVEPEHQDALALAAQMQIAKTFADGAEYVERNPHVVRQQ